MSRKLVTIRTIEHITPIPDADLIECLCIDGWCVVTAKENGFKVGDKCFYFEIDSFLPIKPEFEFLRSKCYYNTPHMGEGFKIKTIKLKKQVSQGLVLPISDFGIITNAFGEEVFSPDGGKTCYPIDSDFSELFGVRLYEAYVPAHLAGVVKGNFPSFIKKTDQDRVQNCFRKHEKSTKLWEMTTKLDGASMTVYYRDGVVGVCSRNLDIVESETNAYWQAARDYNLIEKLKIYGKNIAIQGELYGLGVQKNPDQLNTLSFYLFDVWDINEQRYWHSVQRRAWAKEYMIQHVPFIGYFVFGDYSDFGYEYCASSVKDMINLADNAKSLTGKQAEGIVFKNMGNPNISFKVISNNYLLKQKD